MEPCWALGGKLSEDIPLDAVAVECQHDVLGWISRNHTRRFASDEPLSVMVHASGTWSAEHLEDEKADVRAALESAMSGIGLPLSWDGEPFIHRWRYASGFVNPRPEYILLPKFNLGVCGDWLNGGRVEGAWLSGHKLAIQIEKM
jgi:predicted NAD/FAD-dependent oxidoreductase